MRLLSLILLVLVHGFCRANEADEIHCRCIAPGTAAPLSLINLSPKGAEVDLAAPGNSLSPEITCFATGGSIKFLSASTREVAVNAVIPGRMKDVILVFVVAPKENNVTGWKVHVIDDSAKSFHDGGALVANFFNKDIRFTIGEKAMTLHPGDSAGLARPAGRDDFNMAPVSIKLVNGVAVSNLSESMLRFLPESRYVIFACPDATSARPRIISFQDPKRRAP